MITRVEATSNKGSTLSISLEDPTEGYYIKDIDGLDPVQATIVSSSFANEDGEQYQSSRREKRNIVMKLGLDFGLLPAKALRTQLYKYFMPKSEVRLRFFSDDAEPVEIVGRVESFECPLFVKEPDATISLICVRPDFYELETQVISGVTTATDGEFVIDYDGSVETGIVFKLNVDRAIDEFTIYNRSSDNSLNTLEFVSTLSAGDLVTLSTIPGAKGAVLTRAGSDSSLLYGISPYASWINLQPGPNYLRIQAAGTPGLPYTIEFINRYGGL